MTSDKLTEQLEQMQSQLAFQDDTLHALNDVVAEQDREIQQLNRKVELLIGQLQGLSEAVNEVKPDERPPHY